MPGEPAEATCRSCGAEIDRHAVARGGLCDDLGCRRAGDVLREIRRREERDRERRRRTAAFGAEAARAAGVTGPVLTIVLPSLDHALGPRPERRTRLFRAHILRTIRAAFRREAAEPDGPLPAYDDKYRDPAPTEAALLGAGCATCRGDCCRTGGNTAWLDVDAVRGVLRRRPGVRRRALLAEYLGHLPDQIFANSCVFHAESGCPVPREIRAPICNEYFCRSLQDLRRHIAAGDPEHPVLVAADSEGPRRAFVPPGPLG